MGMFRATLVGVLMVVAGILPGCCRAELGRRPFDVAGQPAATALNAFAQQADITLLFAYDTVRDVHTPPLKGRYTADEGLALLLAGTPLEYQRTQEGIYLVCRRMECPVCASLMPRGGGPGTSDRIADFHRWPVFMTSR